MKKKHIKLPSGAIKIQLSKELTSRKKLSEPFINSKEQSGGKKKKMDHVIMYVFSISHVKERQAHLPQGPE